MKGREREMTAVYSNTGTPERTCTDGLVTDEKVHIKSESNGSVLPTHTVGVAMDIADVGRNALEIEEPPPLKRAKSIYQTYESKVPKRQKNLIANLVSALMILSLWIIFAIPSIWLGWALADYFLDRTDPLSNGTVSEVFKRENCPGNYTIQNAVQQLLKVANGGFNRTNFTCVTTFVSNGTQCVPECLEWYPGGEVYRQINNYAVPIFSLITLIAASVGASTWLCRKSLWKFPHIISLYLIICVIIQVLMIFIASIDRKKFFCSSEDLFVSQRNPTIQCQIQGPVYHFFLLAFFCWYICDIFNIVYVLIFPLKSGNFLAHSGKIHIIQSIISWGIPVLTIAIVLAATSRYGHYSFPILCFPNQYGLLFTFYIPGVSFSILTGTGLILLGLTLYKRHKKIGNASTTNIYLSLLKQMSIYSIALSILLFIIVTKFLLDSLNYKITQLYETAYNWCITAFHETPQCCFQAYAAYYAPFWTLLNESTFCLWGVAAVSVVWVKEAKGVWVNILTCGPCKQKYTKDRVTTGSTV